MRHLVGGNWPATNEVAMFVARLALIWRVAVPVAAVSLAAATAFIVGSAAAIVVRRAEVPFEEALPTAAAAVDAQEACR